MATRRGRPTQAEAKKLDRAVREAAVETVLEMGRDGKLVDAAMMWHAENVLSRQAPL